MKLSIVIVNYNVEYFLEQCLNSVFKALHGISAEVFVVDNNSVDGSVEMVRNRFPGAILISNKENTGFSRANNQAIRMSTGEYVLLLNPDTLVEEDTFQKVISFMDSHPEAGGLGVKMIDGRGNFLPESKRGLPTPAVAFFKIFGLSALFPRSTLFGRYHLGYLSNEETHQVDVLSGAFMLLRRAALDKTGLLDEAFFMYGEDIDLSYRITRAGYKNYYYPGTRIIHYKGESTKKGSLNYVFVFYNAMVIFARKHFSSGNARVFSFFINTAIWLRAFVAVLARFFRITWLPALDFAGIFLLFLVLTNVYERYTGKDLQAEILSDALPVMALLWLLVFFFSSVYDRPYNYRKAGLATLYGLVVSLAVYSVLPEQLRFSRAVILIAPAVVLFWLIFSRWLLKIAGYSFYAERSGGKRFAVVAKSEEFERIHEMAAESAAEGASFMAVHPRQLGQLNDLVRIRDIDEIIFSGKDNSSGEIINAMTGVESSQVNFKIAPPESLFIIGSNSINAKGDLYMVEMSGISSSVNRRNKRLTDLLLCVIFIMTLPILVLFQQRRAAFLKNLVLVLVGELSWVGFNKSYSNTISNRNIKKGVVPVAEPWRGESSVLKINQLYAKNYAWYRDLLVIIQRWTELGNQPV